MPGKVENYGGISRTGVNLKSEIENFLKLEYQEGFVNEFSEMEAVINRLSKDTISGKKKYKSFRLGITDNIFGLGNTGAQSDLYKIRSEDFVQGAETVDAEFDTTKLIGIFSLTDEVIMKGKSDNSLLDVLADKLQSMEAGLKHTMQRYTYGTKLGDIGEVTTGAEAPIVDSANASPGVQGGSAKIDDGRIFKIKVANSYSIQPGMGISLAAPVYVTEDIDDFPTGLTEGDVKVEEKDVDKAKEIFNPSGTGRDDHTQTDPKAVTFVRGKIWQKVNHKLHDESIIIVLDEEYEGITQIPEGAKMYAKQLSGSGAIAHEYHGLGDIVLGINDDKYNLFGVDRNVYQGLKPTVHDLENALLEESLLRDMSDHIHLTSPEHANNDIIISNHRIISSIEKQMYQFKQYSLDTKGSGFELGRPDVQFDGKALVKDKYSRDKNVYLLDTSKIGELLRKEFDWITNGREGVLERLDGTEIFEGIMTKYADMYIDSWRAHAAITNVAEEASGE